MSRDETIKILENYGFSAFKALEIAIDCERNDSSHCKSAEVAKRRRR